MSKSIYHVWRRSDGLVNWTKGANPPADSSDFTFEVLLSTPDMNEAITRLIKETQ